MGFVDFHSFFSIPPAFFSFPQLFPSPSPCFYSLLSPSFSLSPSLHTFSPSIGLGCHHVLRPPSPSCSQHITALFFFPSLHITAPSLSLIFFLSLDIAALSLTLTFSAPSPPPLSIYILPSPTAASHFFSHSFSPSPSLPGPLLFITVPLQSLLFHAIICFLPLSFSLPPSLWLHSLLCPHFVLCHFTPSSMFYLFCCLPHPLDVLYQKVKSNDWCHLSKNVPHNKTKYFLLCFDLCCWTAYVSPWFPQLFHEPKRTFTTNMMLPSVWIQQVFRVGGTTCEYITSLSDTSSCHRETWGCWGVLACFQCLYILFWFC